MFIYFRWKKITAPGKKSKILTFKIHLNIYFRPLFGDWNTCMTLYFKKIMFWYLIKNSCFDLWFPMENEKIAPFFKGANY